MNIRDRTRRRSDHRAAYATEERFPGADVCLVDFAVLSNVLDVAQIDAAVVMSHHLQSDVRYLRVLGGSKGPHYIGLLGPMARHNRVVHALGAAAAALGSRLRGVVGLDIGAAGASDHDSARSAIKVESADANARSRYPACTMKTLIDWLIGWPERVAQHLGSLAPLFARIVVGWVFLWSG